MNYFSRQRNWVSLFGFAAGERVLDIGCAEGVLGKYISKNYSCVVHGIDLLEKNCRTARNSLSHVECLNFETDLLPKEISNYDTIIFSDSLEHMYDTEAVLTKAKSLLKNQDGRILLSIPNIRCFRVTLPLLFQGQFDYQDEGLLDKTHIRFFTKSSFKKICSQVGLDVKRERIDLPLASITGKVNLASLGLFREILTAHHFYECVSCER